MPELLRSAGEAARLAFEEFFHGQIRNPHTRKAYLYAWRLFSAWCAAQRLDLPRVTVNECERLQGFPTDWTAGLAKSRSYACVGNAVTVPVVRAIARHLN